MLSLAGGVLLPWFARIRNPGRNRSEGRPMEAGTASCFCADCGHRALAGSERCPECRSPRLIAHPELFQLPIGHIDCDAFYAAIEKRDRPELRDKPLIIGGGHRGVVSTACYIARISGVRSAMPMFRARALCPQATVLPPDMAKYRKVAERLRTMMLELTPLVEPLSIDEAFLDLSGTEALHKRSPAESLAWIARRAEQELGISVSIGLSHNKFLAKIASDLKKPRGFSVIGRAETMSFLAERPISLIWGVGKATGERLAADGLHRIAQLQTMSRGELVNRYGKMGAHLHDLARGLDDRPVDPESPAKSISSETTFDEDIADPQTLRHELWPLCETVSRRLKHAGLAGEVVHLKLKTASFRLVARQQVLPQPTQLAETLFRTGVALLDRETGNTRYRLIGIGVSGLVGPASADAPDLGDPDGAKRMRIEQAIDSVRAKQGRASIVKGRSLPRATRRD